MRSRTCTRFRLILFEHHITHCLDQIHLIIGVHRQPQTPSVVLTPAFSKGSNDVQLAHRQLYTMLQTPSQVFSGLTGGTHELEAYDQFSIRIGLYPYSGPETPNTYTEYKESHWISVLQRIRSMVVTQCKPVHAVLYSRVSSQNREYSSQKQD